MKINKSIVVLFVVSFVLLRSLFNPGFPGTHDGENHLARLANAALSVRDRAFPIRWAPNLNNGFGYPIFNFNYYFPQVLAFGLSKTGFSFQESMKLVMFLSLFGGGLFIYLFLKRRAGNVAALAGSLFYISAPFQLVTIFARGSMGEVAAFGMIPLILWSIDLLLKEKDKPAFLLTVLSLFAFLFTHNITVLFGIPFLIGYVIFDFKKEKLNKGFFLLLLAFVLSIGMSMFFWTPALLEKKYTNLDKMNLSYQYQDHFLTLKQVFHSPWGYGFSVIGPNDGLSLELGPFHLLVALLSTGLFLFLMIKKKLGGQKKIWIFALMVFYLSVFLMVGISRPVWKYLPFLRYAQFPWRLMIFAIISLSFLAAFFANNFKKIGVVLALAALIYILPVAKSQGGPRYDNNFYYSFPFTTTIKDEYLPIWFNKEKNYELDGKIFGLSGTALIRELKWKTQEHIYEIETPKDTEVLERTAYFPGWEAYVDEKRVNIEYEREDYPGVISFKVPEGKHLVKTLFTENTPARKLGDLLSIISLSLLLLFLIFWDKLMRFYEKRS